jgi:thymidylate synthase (FAD)
MKPGTTKLFKIDVLDHGSVILRNLAGPTRRLWGVRELRSDLGDSQCIEERDFDADDCDVANAARMSFANFDTDVVTLRDGSTRPRTEEDDYKLNEYLWENRHTSPFEMIQVWLEVTVPIMIDRQFVRHRTWKRSEESGRYTVLQDKWYIPEIVGGKSASKKQGQEDNLPQHLQDMFKKDLDEACAMSYGKYQYHLRNGVAPEHARMFLHLNHYVHWLGSVDLHNLFGFLRLRVHEHAQIEAQKFGWAIVDLLEPHLPQLMRIFRKHCVRPT